MPGEDDEDGWTVVKKPSAKPQQSQKINNGTKTSNNVSKTNEQAKNQTIAKHKHTKQSHIQPSQKFSQQSPHPTKTSQPPPQASKSLQQPQSQQSFSQTSQNSSQTKPLHNHQTKKEQQSHTPNQKHEKQKPQNIPSPTPLSSSPASSFSTSPPPSFSTSPSSTTSTSPISSSEFMQPKTRGHKPKQAAYVPPTPPKSILEFGEHTNIFDVACDLDSLYLSKVDNHHKQHANKHHQKPKSNSLIHAANNNNNNNNHNISEANDNTNCNNTNELVIQNNEDMEEELTHFFAILPPEVLLYMLSLFELRTLCKFSILSRFCYYMAVDDALWKPLFIRHWGMRKGGGSVKRKKRKEPEKGKWRRRYLQLFLNQSNAERDKDRKDRLVLMFYTKAFQINMKKAKQQANSKF